MPVFNYVARDGAGRVIKGTREAATSAELAQVLREQGYFVSRVAETTRKPPGPTRSILSFFQRVSLRDLAVFCRQFATMVDAGVSLVRCLAVLEEQTPSARLKEIIRGLQQDVEGGASLSRSLAKYPGVFNNLFIGLVRAGEVGGALDQSLLRLAGFIEKDVALRREIKSAMLYPVLIMLFAIAVVAFLVIWVIPKFMSVFKDLGVTDLPLPTVVILTVSQFMGKRWWVILISIIVLTIAVRAFVRTRFGRRLYDRIKLRVPIFGKINHEICLSRFSRTFATLQASGVPVLQSLETTAEAVANEIMAEAIMKARESIREGERVADPLQQSGMFPPMVIQMVSIGEETGTLDNMLNRVADFYDAEVAAKLAGLTKAIEPLMIIGLGVVVLFILLAVWLPIAGAIASLTGGGGGE